MRRIHLLMLGLFIGAGCGNGGGTAADGSPQANSDANRGDVASVDANVDVEVDASLDANPIGTDDAPLARDSAMATDAADASRFVKIGYAGQVSWIHQMGGLHAPYDMAATFSVDPRLGYLEGEPLASYPCLPGSTRAGDCCFAPYRRPDAGVADGSSPPDPPIEAAQKNVNVGPLTLEVNGQSDGQAIWTVGGYLWQKAEPAAHLWESGDEVSAAGAGGNGFPAFAGKTRFGSPLDTPTPAEIDSNRELVLGWTPDPKAYSVLLTVTGPKLEPTSGQVTCSVYDAAGTVKVPAQLTRMLGPGQGYYTIERRTLTRTPQNVLLTTVQIIQANVDLK